MATPQHEPRHTELTNYTVTKYQDGYTSRKKATTKLTLMIKLAMYSNIYLAFNLFLDLSCSNDYGVPCKFAQATRSVLPLVCDVTLAVMNRSDKHTKTIEVK